MKKQAQNEVAFDDKCIKENKKMEMKILIAIVVIILGMATYTTVQVNRLRDDTIEALILIAMKIKRGELKDES